MSAVRGYIQPMPTSPHPFVWPTVARSSTINPTGYHVRSMKQPLTTNSNRVTPPSRSHMKLRFSLHFAVVFFTLLTSAILHAQTPDPLHTASRQELNIIKCPHSPGERLEQGRPHGLRRHLQGLSRHPRHHPPGLPRLRWPARRVQTRLPQQGRNGHPHLL